MTTKAARARKRLGKSIARAREAAKIKQAELARRIGKSRSTVNEYETGQHEPPLDVLTQIAEETDTPLIELITARAS